MTRTTKDSLETLALHIDPVIPKGKGFTSAEFSERYSVAPSAAFRMIHKLVRSKKIQKIGVRPGPTGHHLFVYDVIGGKK